jgi:nicotinate-nucleotide adenylyltransferase
MGKVGIFAGTFDPIHNGHIAFANQAIVACNLQKVIFLPERQPRYKTQVASIEHRMAMIHDAIANNAKYDVLQLPEQQFSVSQTLPELQKLFPNDRLVLLVGSDVASNMAQWPDSTQLFASTDIIVGMRANTAKPELPGRVTFLEHTLPHVTSSSVREGAVRDVAPVVRKYISRHRLYNV